VVLHRAWADEQLGGDVPVAFSPAHQRGDLGLLGRELLRKAGFPLAEAFVATISFDAELDEALLRVDTSIKSDEGIMT
jgi:hypothetical protein